MPDEEDSPVARKSMTDDMRKGVESVSKSVGTGIKLSLKGMGHALSTIAPSVKSPRSSFSDARSPRSSSSDADIVEKDDEAGVTYRVLRAAHAEPTKRAVALALLEQGDPLAEATGAARTDIDALCELHMPFALACNVSMVAVDSRTGDVLGAALCEDFIKRPTQLQLESVYTDAQGDWRPFVEMTAAAEAAVREKMQDHDALGPQISAGGTTSCRTRVLELWKLVVVPNARGQHIGVKLAKHAVSCAVANGFARVFAICPDHPSTRLLGKHVGASSERFIDYSHWKGNAEEAIKTLPAKGHFGMSLMVVDTHLFHRV